MIEIIYADGVSEKELIKDMRSRAKKVSNEISQSVSVILDEISENGIEAVNKYSVKFDGVPAREISKEEIKNAYDACPDNIKAALEQAADNIGKYHEKMLAKSWQWNMHTFFKPPNPPHSDALWATKFYAAV